MPTSGPDLRQIIKAIYRMGPDRERAEFERIFRDRRDAYRSTLADEARALGCGQAAGRAAPPRGASLNALRRESRQDALSIRQTWNRDVDAEVDRLYAENPRGNRYFYYSRMERWANERAVWKEMQIAAATLGFARSLARSDFEQFNGLLDAGYRLTGPTPKCDDCSTLMQMGTVTRQVKEDNEMPLHIGCWHDWLRILQGAVDCRALWVG